MKDTTMRADAALRPYSCQHVSTFNLERTYPDRPRRNVTVVGEKFARRGFTRVTLLKSTA
jgi:hypothetical protein